MSRLGKLPVQYNEQVQAKIEKNTIIIKGPKGELTQELHDLVRVNVEEKEIIIQPIKENDIKSKAMWGLYRSLINNMVLGVTEGFEKKLEINGVGYKAAAQGRKIILHVGYSHPVEFNLPEGINAEVTDNVITISGINKQLVGEMAAQIRKIRKPEPYKGKGIKYVDEVIRRKVGKAAAKGGE